MSGYEYAVDQAVIWTKELEKFERTHGDKLGGEDHIRWAQSGIEPADKTKIPLYQEYDRLRSNMEGWLAEAERHPEPMRKPEPC